MGYVLQDRNSAPQRQEKNVAFPTAAEIAQRRGGRQESGQWKICCPAHEDSTPSCSVMDGVVRGVPRAMFHCHAGCSFQDVIDALVSDGDWPAWEVGERRETPPPPRLSVVKPTLSAKDLENRRLAIGIWQDATPFISWSPVEYYLRRRGIWSVTSDARLRYAELRHPQTGKENVPALIVPRMDPQGAVVAIQQIFLTPGGKRYRKLIVDDHGCERAADVKRSLGRGGEFDTWARLHDATDRLILAEGPETALSVAKTLNRPCWAHCGSLPKEIDLPECVRDVFIAADNDANGGSQAKAEKLCEFIRSTGRTCEWDYPVRPENVNPKKGWDYNDELLSLMTPEQKAEELKAIADMQSLIQRAIAQGCCLGEVEA